MKYVVLEKEGFTGLTFGSHVLRPGQIFDDSKWPYSKESLEAAVKNGRCEQVKEKKEEQSSKKKSKSSDENKVGDE